MAITKIGSTADVYLGPKVIEEDTDRRKSFYASNEAPSYIPPKLLDLDGEGAHKKDVDDLVNSTLITQESTLEFLQSIKSDIKNHAEYRLQVFFQQLLIVYRTKFVFQECGTAEAQVGGKGIASDRKYAAAHSSTLTCLRFNETKNKIVSFINGAFFHKTWNATVLLPRPVNEVDSDLDWRTKDANGITFRSQCIDILNKVSEGTYTPRKGFVKFIRQALTDLKRLKANNEDPQRLFVIKMYKYMFKQYREQVLEGDEIIKSLTFVPSNLETVTKKYFLRVQASMHKKIKREMSLAQCGEEITKKLEDLKIKQRLPEITQWAIVKMGQLKGNTTEAIHKALCGSNGNFVQIRNTAAKYKILCICTKKVRVAVQSYLNGVQDVKIFQKDLSILRKNVWTKETLKTMSKPLKKVYDVVIDVIKKKPQQLHMIMLHLLYDLSFKQNVVLQKIYPMNETQFYEFQAENPTAVMKIAEEELKPQFQGIKQRILQHAVQ